jgi:hypothetical protein
MLKTVEGNIAEGEAQKILGNPERETRHSEPFIEKPEGFLFCKPMLW